MRRLRPPTLVLMGLFLGGCSRAEPAPQTEPGTRAASSGVRALAGPLVLARGVRIVRAGEGSDAARVVREERERAKGDQRELVVYVGATWCEPCRAFHAAALKGELDNDFPSLTLLEFDIDDDRDRLGAAGYRSQYIPLFVMPDADGRASSKKFEGAVKGSGAVGNIAPRLRSLLSK